MNVPFVAGLDFSCVTGAVPGRQYFECESNNQLVNVTCSFDGGPEEDCSLPLVVTIDRFGTDSHTVAITATDEFGQSQSVDYRFQLIERKNSYCVSFSKISATFFSFTAPTPPQPPPPGNSHTAIKCFQTFEATNYTLL